MSSQHTSAMKAWQQIKASMQGQPDSQLALQLLQQEQAQQAQQQAPQQAPPQPPQPGWDPNQGPLIGHLTDGLEAPQPASPADAPIAQDLPPIAQMPPQMGPELAGQVSTLMPKMARNIQSCAPAARST